MPYNSVTEHPGPLKLSMVSTQICGLVSKSVDRISKFALIKKLGKKFKIFGLGRVRHLGFRHLGFSHLGITHGYHSGRGCHGNIGPSASSDLASITWHVTHVIGLGDLLWLTQKPYISILLTRKKCTHSLLTYLKNMLK